MGSLSSWLISLRGVSRLRAMHVVPPHPMSHPEHHNIEIPTISTRHNSTTMDPIQEAIGYFESHKGEEQLSYRQVAKILGVDRTTLSRRHNCRTRSNAEEARQRQLLSPLQEEEPVKYIERCKGRLATH
jgi:hypothetical protein